MGGTGRENGTAVARGDAGGHESLAGVAVAPGGQVAADGVISPAERRLLAVTPLHAITAAYGTPGLRERLAIETESLPGAERDRIARALDLATRLHADDHRQREPYANHVLRVAIRIITYYGVTDPDVICAALLHDTVEDHPRDLAPGGGQAEALAAIAGHFGHRVAELVAAVTNPPPEPGIDRNAQYREHVAAALDANPWARVIKMSDYTDNAVGLVHTTGPKMERLAAKYAPLRPILRELIARPDTPLSAEAKEHILGQLDLGAARFAAIWKRNVTDPAAPISAMRSKDSRQPDQDASEDHENDGSCDENSCQP